MAVIGVQAMMLKQIVSEVGPFEAMRQLTQVGFTVTEVSQIPMTPDNVAELARAREELGVTFAALSAGLAPMAGGNDSLRTAFDKIVSDAQALGSTMLRVAALPFDAMADRAMLVDASVELEGFSKRLRDQGITLYYHNHHLEFAKLDGVFIHDIIAEHAPSVDFELDVHWLQRAGLILSPEHHAIHHAAPHDRHYCITVGWMNPMLDKLGFFRGLEAVVARISPRALRPDL